MSVRRGGRGGIDRHSPEARVRAELADWHSSGPGAEDRAAREETDREALEVNGFTTADGVFHACRMGEPMSPRLADIGRALRQRRTAARLSLDDVARVSGVERSAVAKLERGANTNPTVSTLDRVMHALGGRLRIEFESDEPRRG